MWLVHSARKHDHVTPLLRDLHWLRMWQRINYKLTVLIFHCLCGPVPSYLTSRRARSWLTKASAIGVECACGSTHSLLDHRWSSIPSGHIASLELPSAGRHVAAITDRVQVTAHDCCLRAVTTVNATHFCVAILSFYLLIEWLRERTKHLDIFLFSTHHSVVFYFQCSVYWWMGSVRF